MNKRIYEILNILLENDEPITVDTLVKLINASNKTIRTNLKEAEIICAEFNLNLSKKTGVGIALLGDATNKLTLKNYLNARSNDTSEQSPQYRRVYLALRLLTAQDTVSFTALASELYVSKATVHKDIRSLKPFFEVYKLSIISYSNGICVQGKERHIREMIYSFMKHEAGYYKLATILMNNNLLDENCFIYSALDYTLKDFKDIFDLVTNLHLPLFKELSFGSMQTLLTRIFINTIRVMDDKTVNLSDDFRSELKNHDYYEEAQQIYEAIGKHFNIEFSEIEIIYLQVYICSIVTKELHTNDKKLNPLTPFFVKQLISSLATITNINLLNDKQLYEALFKHCEPAMVRFQYAIPNENPLLPVIKNQFKNSFAITKKACKIVEKDFDFDISDDEIGYITLHLALAINRNKKKLKTLLLSENGGGVNNLLTSMINTQVPYLNITDCISIFDCDKYNIEAFDFIISTSNNIPHFSIPSIIVNPVINNEDIIKLDKITRAIYNEINDPAKLLSIDL